MPLDAFCDIVVVAGVVTTVTTVVGIGDSRSWITQKSKQILPFEKENQDQQNIDS